MTQHPRWLDQSFNAAATKTFFKDEMELADALIARLEKDGVKNVQQLKSKYRINWELMHKTSIQRDSSIKDHFGDHSLAKLIVASDAVRYYIAVGRIISPAMMKWEVLENFKDGMDAIAELKAMTPQAIPRLTKSFGPIKWAQSFLSVLSGWFGTRTDPPVPLAYICRDQEEPTDPPPALEVDEGFSKDGSYVEELVARVSLKGAKAKSDSALVWTKLEEATRTSEYHSTVMQYPKKGRTAFQALISQHLGDDKWSAEIRKHEGILRDSKLKWKGTGNFPLEKFIGIHRRSYNVLVLAAQHVQYQLPVAHTRVTYLLDNITTTDSDLAAAKSSIVQDKAPGGKRENFAAAAVVLQEACPVAKRQAGSKRAIGDISDVTGMEADVSSLHTGKGKTGVDFRFYDKHEYGKLTKAQKTELREWREKTKEGQAAKALGKAQSANKRKSQQQSKEDKKKAFDTAVDE